LYKDPTVLSFPLQLGFPGLNTTAHLVLDYFIVSWSERFWTEQGRSGSTGWHPSYYSDSL